MNAATIAKYARSAQHVLAILKRLGGTEFQEAFGGLVCLIIFPSSPYQFC